MAMRSDGKCPTGVTVSDLQKHHPDKLNISSRDPAEAVVTQLVARLFAAARQYEVGLIDDLDTEFVHRYRVLIRKSRALLSLFKKTLSTQRHRELRSALKGFAGATGRLRDLDVFLLAADSYRQALLPAQHAEAQQLFARIEGLRREAWQETAAVLQGDRYRAEAERVLGVMQAGPDCCGSSSQVAIEPLVKEKALVQFDRIVSIARQVDLHSPATAIHRLRIECKRLRYLLELFDSFFLEKDIPRLVAQLKGVQDCLGHFNDLAVQRSLLAELAGRAKTEAGQRACIESLQEGLAARQSAVHRQLLQELAMFSDPARNKSMRQVFSF